MTTPLPPGWEQDILSGIRAPVTPTDVQELDLWQQTEGGSTNNPDAFNPFNTTRNTGPAGEPLGGTPTNSVGVLSFPSWLAGEQATVATLEQPNMSGIVSALDASAPVPAFEAAVNASPWGTTFSGAPATSSSPTSATDVLNLSPSSIAGAVGSAVGSGLTAGLKAILPTVARIFLYVAFVAGGIVLVVLGLQRLTGAKASGLPIPIPIPA